MKLTGVNFNADRCPVYGVVEIGFSSRQVMARGLPEPCECLGEGCQL